MKSKEATWYVYMVSCADGSLYTGITTNLQRRIAEHNSPRSGAKYTRSRQPVRLAFHEKYSTRSTAGKRENTIKKLSVAEKRALLSHLP